MKVSDQHFSHIEIEMEKNKSLTSNLKTCSISYISPVKKFDQPPENDLHFKKVSKSKHLEKNNNIQSLKNAELQSTVNRQQTEIKQLKDVILVKNEDYEKVKMRLDRATKLLDDIAHGKSNTNEVNDFLGENSKKRKGCAETEKCVKKRKEEESEDQKLLSFNMEEAAPNVKRRKRKLENQEMLDLNIILKKPTKAEFEREMNLTKLDEKIKTDTENFKKRDEKWKQEDQKKQELKELGRIEKQRATKFKESIRNNLSVEDLVKMTRENMDFLSRIVSGEIESPKHSLYYDKCGKKSQSLLYTTVNEPFSDDQVDKVYALVNEKFKSVPQVEGNYIREAIILCLNSGIFFKINFVLQAKLK